MLPPPVAADVELELPDVGTEPSDLLAAHGKMLFTRVAGSAGILSSSAMYSTHGSSGGTGGVPGMVKVRDVLRNVLILGLSVADSS